MARRLIWSPKAKQDRKEILEYWKSHNVTTEYSRKLNTLFKAASEKAFAYPDAGSATDMKGVRMRRVRAYKVFYQVSEAEVVILRIWDSRRDPKTLEL